jgi:quinol monooxygenase YgiN
VIIISGSITATEETIDELATLSVEHCRRSRLEPGCLAHSASRDVENPLRIIFTERWADMDAVRTHFAVKASGEFVRRAISLCEHPPVLELFDAAGVPEFSAR